MPPLSNSTTSGTRVANNDVRWTGSGFLYGYRENRDDSILSTVVVTNRHVSKIGNIVFRAIPATEKPQNTVVEVRSDDVFYHPDEYVDISVIRCPFLWVREAGSDITCFDSVDQTATIKEMEEGGVSEGDLVYLIGFPFGDVMPEHHAPYVRLGCIARIRDVFRGKLKPFYVDGFVFGGNSRGPVILRPESASGSASLIGVVSAFRTSEIHKDGEKQNTGLTLVWPMNFVNEAVAECRRVSRQTGR